ncbi:hypothetical protein C1J05_04045 [Sulfitobacter sp. JL08]|uniref:DUF6538 domain-containing protein n=1 Tax=Sulfitobacter sp. JL08 TaxID=2070369 RepID=UPI000E0AB865|nr:DUF6538 domain-containing protein [Sulfitobacter sp. JL08]AXI53780.1 hypothetical protein C1J05_04045 [Sulfitobacter sp. JL08]
MVELPHTTLVKIKDKYYVNCTIPDDLRPFFKGRKQIRRSTGTADKSLAERRKHSISSKIYAEFDAARPDPISELFRMIDFPKHIEDKLYDVPPEDDGFEDWEPELTKADLQDLLAVARVAMTKVEPWETVGRTPEPEARRKGREAYLILKEMLTDTKTTKSSSGCPVLSVVQKDYLATKPYGPAKTMRDAELAITEFIDFTKDIALDGVTAVLIHSYAEKIGETKSRETVAKKIGYVKRMFDWAVRKGFVETNIFMTVKLDKKLGTARASYQPFTNAELESLFSLKMPDHLRNLLSILATTGMRLDEAALLDWENIKTEAGILHFDLTDSIVKTKGSARKVPIPKVIQPLFISPAKGPLFPEFSRDKDGKAQAPASKALMKQIRKVTGDRLKVVHSLRGNLKDLLRDAGISKEVNDFITGHGSGDVAGSYGSGPSLKVRADALNSVEHPWLRTR